jgi:RsiW-degrading membrane proteinase PrsW (M82 family)
MSYCTECGQKLEPAMLFCTGCGASLAALSPAAAPSRAVSAIPQAQSTSIPVGPLSQPSSSADIRLIVIACASGLVSIGGFIAGLTDLLPSGISTVIVLIGVSIGLRVLWSYAARSASSSSRARTIQIISNVGLAISVLSILIGLPRITRGAGIGTFLVDGIAELWTIAILTVVASQVRTLNWRIFVGAGLTGFLAITGLARLVGVPLIENLGQSSAFAVAMWVPFTEELFKLIPVMIVLIAALRHSHVRPSAMDLTLLGACTGCGFALYENATLSRGHFSFTAAPLISFVFPSNGAGRAFGWSLMQTGHLCHTALIALGLALALLYYRKTKRLKWIVPSIAIAVVLLEHCSQNAIVVGGLNEVIAKIVLVLTLGGWLSSLLLIAGVGFVFMMEWRILGGSFRVNELRGLSASEAFRRSTLLARAQTGGA